MTFLLTLLVAACAGAACANVLIDLTRGVQKEVASVKQPVVSTVVGVGSSQCTNVKKLFGVEYEQVQGAREPDLNQLSLKYVTPNLNVSFNINTVSETLLKLPSGSKLMVYIHGFTDDPTKSSFGEISKAVIQTGEYNILALDGSSLIRWLYLRSTTYVRFMGEKLGSILAAIVNSGFDPANIYLVGHSLGAHISGFAGKKFTELTGMKVARLTALDPAGPCFTAVPEDLRLKATDAEFVDAIHTDAGVYGMRDPVAQVDFYPNSGSQQPNCFFDTCNHSRAWQYFAASVLSREAFPAVACASWEAFRKSSCDTSDISYMGIAAKPGTTGLYYLQTSGDAPFGLGMDGTVYKNNEGIVKNLFGK